MESKFVRSALALGAALLAGCGDSTRPGNFPPIRLVAGADASDTVRSVLPQDTALYVGASFTPNGSAVDAFQNPAEGDISFWTIGSSISYADGAWVYYARLESDYAIYRAHTDGTGDEALAITSQPNAVSPSPAPDGARLVFSTGDWGKLAIVDLASGEWSYVESALGTSPAWPPDGSRIAYVATGSDGARLHTVAPDGSGDHRVGDENSSYDVGIDWSPDGKWIIARNSSHNYLELIDVATNVSYPLPYTTGYGGPSWKP